MESAIITSVISSVCTLIGVIITVSVSAKKQRTEMEISQKFQQKEIDDIKDKLKQHNDYAVKIPVIETELKYIRENVTDIKNKMGA